MKPDSVFKTELIMPFNTVLFFVMTPNIWKINSVCSTHQTGMCVCLVSVHLGNQALTCSSVCVHCRHDACALRLQGSHVRCRSLTRMSRTHPTHSIKTHYCIHCIYFTDNAHPKKVIISLIPSAVVVCCALAWEKQKKSLLRWEFHYGATNLTV